MKKLLTLLVTTSLLAFGAANAGCSSTATSRTLSVIDTAPKSVIHVISLAVKEGTTPEQIKAALDGVQKLPAAYPGITRVWTKAIKVQSPSEVKLKKKTHVIVMEFASEQALKDYTDSPAQKEWYKVYLPIRDESTTCDVTN